MHRHILVHRHTDASSIRCSHTIYTEGNSSYSSRVIYFPSLNKTYMGTSRIAFIVSKHITIELIYYLGATGVSSTLVYIQFLSKSIHLLSLYFVPFPSGIMSTVLILICQYISGCFFSNWTTLYSFRYILFSYSYIILFFYFFTSDRVHAAAPLLVAHIDCRIF